MEPTIESQGQQQQQQLAELSRTETRYWLVVIPYHGMTIYLPASVAKEIDITRSPLACLMAGFDTVPLTQDFQSALEQLARNHQLTLARQTLHQGGQYTVLDEQGLFHSITVCFLDCETPPKSLAAVSFTEAMSTIKALTPNLHWAFTTLTTKHEAISETRLPKDEPKDNRKGKTGKTPRRKKPEVTNPAQGSPDQNIRPETTPPTPSNKEYKRRQETALVGNPFLDQTGPLTLIIPERYSPMLSRDEKQKMWTAFGPRTCMICSGNHRHEAQKLARALPGFDILKGTDALIYLGEFSTIGAQGTIKVHVYRAMLDTIEAQYNLGLRFVQIGELAETDGSHDDATHELYAQIRHKMN